MLRFCGASKRRDFPRLLSFQLSSSKRQIVVRQSVAASPAASSFASRCSNRCWAVGIMYLEMLPRLAGGKDGASEGLVSTPAGSPRVQRQVRRTPIPDNAREHFEVAITDDLSGVRQQLISADWHGRLAG